MKKLILAALLISTAAFAGQSSGSAGSAAGGGGTVGSDDGQSRAFRINPYSVSGGYAIAWGVPGEMTNFEQLDKDQKQAEQFISQHKLQNYLVDLETNKVLLTLHLLSPRAGDFVDYRFGGWGPRETMNLVSLNIQDNQGNDDVLALISNYKWDNEVDSVFVIHHDYQTMQTTVTKQISGTQLQDAVMNALRAGLTDEQRKIFDSAAVITFSGDRDFVKGQIVQDVYVGAEIPKEDAPALDVDAKLLLTFDGNNFSVKVLSETAVLSQ